MVVDDNTEVLEYLAFMLERAGHSVDCVTTGDSAKSRLRESDFDLVITDIYMPSGTGFDVLEGMKYDGIEVPVIVITGGFDGLSLPYQEACRTLGARAILRKPFSVGEFLSAVNMFRRDARRSP